MRKHGGGISEVLGRVCLRIANKSRIVPEIAVSMLRDAATSRDRALVRGLLPKARTSLELARTGKRGFWAGQIRPLAAAIEAAESALESPFSVRRRVANELANDMRAGLRQLIGHLDHLGPSDPMFAQFRDMALKPFASLTDE